MSTTITLKADSGGFAENKDEARMIRTTRLLPVLDRGEEITLDFSEIRYATQSYVHVLINEALVKHGETALHLIEFKNCSQQLRSVIELVVDYSLDGFAPTATSTKVSQSH